MSFSDYVSLPISTESKDSVPMEKPKTKESMFTTAVVMFFVIVVVVIYLILYWTNPKFCNSTDQDPITLKYKPDIGKCLLYSIVISVIFTIVFLCCKVK